MRFSARSRHERRCDGLGFCRGWGSCGAVPHDEADEHGDCYCAAALLSLLLRWRRRLLLLFAKFAASTTAAAVLEARFQT